MHNWRKAAYASTVMLSLLILATVCPISFSSNTPAEATTGAATESTLTFNASSNTASVSLNVTDASGSFATSTSGQMASFNISTNNATGYTLTIRTSGTDYALGSTIDTLSSTKTASNFELNKWGLLPSKVNGSDNTGANANYYPASSTITLNTTDCANGTGGADSTCASNSDTYTIGLGLKADYSIPAGTYTNTTLIVEYVANPVSYIINYDKNTTDDVSNMPTNNQQAGSVLNPTSPSGDILVNLASAPTRTGYDFIGWCLGTANSSNTTTTNNIDSCSSTTFSAGQSFGMDTVTGDNTYYLYAMWSIASYTITITNSNTTSGASSITVPYGGSNTVTVTPNSNYYLSSVSCPSGYTCTGYGTGSSYTGQQTVTVTNNNTTSGGTLGFTGTLAKLWFQNATSAQCGQTMYDNRGNATYKNVAYTTAKIGSLCWMTRNLDLPGGTTITSLDSNITASSYTLPASSTMGFSYNSIAYVYNSDSTSFNDTSCGSRNPCYSYYSYAAATAGTNPSSGAAGSDICPKGWRLPTKAEIDTLKSTYTTGATLTASPFLGVYGGYYVEGLFNGGGSYGYYWSSTAHNANYAYRLYFYSGSADTGNYDKYFGASIRCVAKS